MFQLFIDRQMDAKEAAEITASYFGPGHTVAQFASLTEMIEQDGDFGGIAVFLRPLSETYPVILEIWIPGAITMKEEEQFALHFSHHASCRSIIGDDQINPYS
jgi:hypothetical protein